MLLLSRSYRGSAALRGDGPLCRLTATPASMLRRSKAGVDGLRDFGRAVRLGLRPLSLAIPDTMLDRCLSQLGLRMIGRLHGF